MNTTYTLHPCFVCVCVCVVLLLLPRTFRILILYRLYIASMFVAIQYFVFQFYLFISFFFFILFKLAAPNHSNAQYIFFCSLLCERMCVCVSSNTCQYQSQIEFLLSFHLFSSVQKKMNANSCLSQMKSYTHKTLSLFDCLFVCMLLLLLFSSLLLPIFHIKMTSYYNH